MGPIGLKTVGMIGMQSRNGTAGAKTRGKRTDTQTGRIGSGRKGGQIRTIGLKAKNKSVNARLVLWREKLNSTPNFLNKDLTLISFG